MNQADCAVSMLARGIYRGGAMAHGDDIIMPAYVLAHHGMMSYLFSATVDYHRGKAEAEMLTAAEKSTQT